MKNLHALVMAGGSGTRFWPLSREQWPKQMLDIVGEGTMISQTINRMRGLVAAGNIHILTTKAHAGDIRLHLKGAGRKAVSVFNEPCARNTAAAIGLAAVRLKKLDPESIMIVLPADHYISDTKAFLRTLRSGVAGAEMSRLVTIGIVPMRPDTGYGYIEKGSEYGRGLYKVRRFVEKPDIKRANEYLRQGCYYWNSGIFIWKTSAILSEIRKRMPVMYKGLRKIGAAIGTEREEMVLDEVYPSLEDISIDYGVMEKSDRVLMVEAGFGWSDLGTWSALDDVLRKDKAGNIARGDVLDIESENSIIFAGGRFVATVGLRDMVVVDTPDATLVCPKERSQDVRKVVAELKRMDRDEHKVHRTVERPWGSYTVLEKGPGYKIKRIDIKPGGKLSLQYHMKRSEHWVVISGTARVTRDNEVFDLRTNESTYIPISIAHRLENPGKKRLQIIEVQNGSYLEEDDIVRLEDIYER